MSNNKNNFDFDNGGLSDKLERLASEGKLAKDQKKKRSVEARERKEKLSGSKSCSQLGLLDKIYYSAADFFKGLWSDLLEMIKTGRFKRSSAAFLLAVLFVALVVLMNIAAVVLTERYSFFSADMTANKIYTLSDVTLELLEKLDMRVEIDIIATENDCYYASVDTDPYGHIAMAAELIKRYEQKSEYIKVEFIDIEQNPGFLDLIPEYRDSIGYYSVVVRSPLRTRVTSFYEMLPSLSNTVSTDGTSVDIAASTTETCVSSLIKTVTIDEVPAVAYLDVLGGGESIDNLLNALYINGYQIYTSSDFAFGYEAIPEDVGLIIIASPQYDLSSTQLMHLSDWLRNGGELGKTLMVFSSNLMSEMPNLETLLEEWGLGYTRNTVYEGDASMVLPSMKADNFYSSFLESTYVRDDVISKPLVVSGALDITFSGQQHGEMVVNGILCSSTSGRISKPGVEYNASDYTAADGDVRCIMAQSTLYKSLDDGSQIRSDVVLAPVTLCEDEYFNSAAYSNFTLLMRVCNERSGIDDNNLNIAAKSLTASDFSADVTSVVVLTVIFGYIVPIGLAAAGFIVYIKRRRL